MTALNCIPTEDFNLFLHALRTRRLELIPGGARVVLSGGAAGRWYFDWFAEHYPTEVERHIGVEYFGPRPESLPDGIDWLSRTLGDLSPVDDGEVDLVFAGQVIEHLWPEEVAGFLGEAHRVLAVGGLLVVDSPTRFITAALGWTQPEHTIELEVDEITELLGLAGFVDVEIAGIWLCYDRERQRVLPLDVNGGGEEWPWRRRVAEADRKPEDSFLWWAQARKGARPADLTGLQRRMQQIYEQARPAYFVRVRSDLCRQESASSGQHVRASQGQAGLLLRGPGIAMPPGRHVARIRLRAEASEGPIAPHHTVAQLEVTRDGGRPIATWSLSADNLPPGGAERHVAIPFELEDTAFDWELRVRSPGVAPLVAALPPVVTEHARGGLTRTVRPVQPDPMRLRTRMALWHCARAAAWPVRRVLDPRLEGLRQHAEFVSSTVMQRFDARTAELETRIEALAGALEHRVAVSSSSERRVVLPCILRAIGGLEPGSSVSVVDSIGIAPAAVLASLGYNVVSTTDFEPTGPIAAAVVRNGLVTERDVQRATSTLQPGGIVVVISEGEGRQSIADLLRDLEIESVREIEPEARTTSQRLILAVARLPEL
jgi:SAM-dependent methyltransferase